MTAQPRRKARGERSCGSGDEMQAPRAWTRQLEYVMRVEAEEIFVPLLDHSCLCRGRATAENRRLTCPVVYLRTQVSRVPAVPVLLFFWFQKLFFHVGSAAHVTFRLTTLVCGGRRLIPCWCLMARLILPRQRSKVPCLTNHPVGVLGSSHVVLGSLCCLAYSQKLDAGFGHSLLYCRARRDTSLGS